LCKELGYKKLKGAYPSYRDVLMNLAEPFRGTAELAKYVLNIALFPCHGRPYIHEVESSYPARFSKLAEEFGVDMKAIATKIAEERKPKEKPAPKKQPAKPNAKKKAAA
jgi:hypothetical protein